MSLQTNVEGTIAFSTLLVIGKRGIKLFSVRVNLAEFPHLTGDGYKQQVLGCILHLALMSGFTQEDILRAATPCPDVDRKKAKPS